MFRSENETENSSENSKKDNLKILGIVGGAAAVGLGLWALFGAGGEEKKDKCFGKFKCTNCKNTWTSAYCWPGYTQQCKKCFTKVEAYEQRPLKQQDEDEASKKPHYENLCEKCQELGYNCKNSC